MVSKVRIIWKQWLKQGYDRGTTIGPVPRDEEIVAAAKLLLGM